MSRVLAAVTVAGDRTAPRLVAANIAAAVAGHVARPLDHVHLAVHEAVANAVLHGGWRVDVLARTDGTITQLDVVDDGGPHGVTPRPADVTPGRVDRRPDAERGRGLTLLAASCDQLEVTNAPGAGRRVRASYAAGPELAVVSPPGQP